MTPPYLLWCLYKIVIRRAFGNPFKIERTKKMNNLTPEQRAFYEKQIAKIRQELASAEFVMNNPQEVDGQVNQSVDFYIEWVIRYAKKIQQVARGESKEHLKLAAQKNEPAL